MIPLFKYEVCFVMSDNVDPHIVEVEADGYDNTGLGSGVNEVPSVVFEREVPDPENDDETTMLTVFEIPAHRIVYIKTLEGGQVASAAGDAEPVAPEKDATHGGYPDPGSDLGAGAI